MKLLVIEDDQKSVKRIMDFATDEGWDKVCVNFGEASNRIISFEPDIVVMDWMYDAEETRKGEELLDLIWNRDFCPVVVYSAIAGTIDIDTEKRNNPLILIEPKGDEEKVVEILKKWVPYVPSIQDLKKELNKALINASKSIKLFNIAGYPGDEIVKYMIAKRAANHFNQELLYSAAFPAWVEYIYPPMSKELFVGDILRVISREADYSQPGLCSEYQVILSPSCDMANAAHIVLLTAECEEKSKFAGESFTANEINGTSQTKREDRIDKVSKLLNQGYNNKFVPLPEMSGVLPYMTINLKKLKYDILKSKVAPDFESIEEGVHTHYRVASIDSPFREQLVWAHMLNSCRPGVPNRDTLSWAEGVLTP
jgi:hypothetical protein